MDDLSIVIPVNHGDESWRGLVEGLLKMRSAFEILLVGPDFHERTSDDSRLHYVYSEKGRAKQQNTGAIKASKSFVWFLHADSVLSENSLETIEKKLHKKPDAIFFFNLEFLSDGPGLMVLNDIGTYWRSHLFKMPFGDQGFFMARKTFFSLGLYDESAKYGEDHLLIWRAHQRGVEVLPCHKKLFTSARKYEKAGWLVTTIRHVALTYKQAFPELLKYFGQKKKTSAIAIFVKTPGLSTVKSRLAANIGKENAEIFFRLSVKATEAAVIEAIRKSDGKLEAYWAVAEEEAAGLSVWSSLKTIYQGKGELGDRLATVYSALQREHEGVFLMGADLPHIEYQTILQGHLELLASDKFILGETEDGGFYLFGGKRPIEKSVWTSVEYSSEKTSAELVKILGKENFIFLGKKFDIDFVEDLRKLGLYKTEGMLAQQIEVIEAAKTLSHV